MQQAIAEKGMERLAPNAVPTHERTVDRPDPIAVERRTLVIPRDGSRVERMAKRTLDVVGALVLLVLTLPVMVVVAIAVKASSPGPVLFRQARVGWGGEPFTCLKFRTMVEEADVIRDRLLPYNDCDGVIFKMRADPRITPIGRILRRCSIDELPQLLHVVTGHMSLVGPRPPLPAEVSQYDELVCSRLLVRPGLTGLWQVSGRSDLSWEESVDLDLHYVASWTFALDLRILLRTVPAVLLGRGAY